MCYILCIEFKEKTIHSPVTSAGAWEMVGRKEQLANLSLNLFLPIEQWN